MIYGINRKTIWWSRKQSYFTTTSLTDTSTCWFRTSSYSAVSVLESTYWIIWMVLFILKVKNIQYVIHWYTTNLKKMKLVLQFTFMGLGINLHFVLPMLPSNQMVKQDIGPDDQTRQNRSKNGPLIRLGMPKLKKQGRLMTMILMIPLLKNLRVVQYCGILTIWITLKRGLEGCRLFFISIITLKD